MGEVQGVAEPPKITVKAREGAQRPGCAGAEGLPGIWGRNAQMVAAELVRSSPARQPADLFRNG